MKIDHFLIFLAVWVISPSLWAGLGVAYIGIGWNYKSAHLVACPIVFIYFYGRDWQGGVFKVVKKDFFYCF